MNITQMTITELKSLAYDQVVLLEQTQMNLKTVNEEIAKKSNEPKPEEVEEVKPEEVKSTNKK